MNRMIRQTVSPCTLLVVVMLFLSGTAGAQSQQKQQQRGCFDPEINLPSCSAPVEGIDPSFDANTLQQICATLEMDYLWNIQYGPAEQHAEALSQIPADSNLCHAAQQAYHQCYWCTPGANFPYCMFYTCDKPDQVDESVDIEATCDTLVDMFHRSEWPATIDLCHAAEQAKHHCPILCDETQLDSLGAAASPQKKNVRIWMSRAGAILSFLGASYILWDALSKPENRTTVYHQLLIGMACFDIVTAVAWSLATTPIPQDEGFYIEGASGDHATCKTQAYFVQLGFTSVFYNVSLALYYLLVIVYSWRERSLKKIRIYLHGIPLLVGFGLAFGGIKFYDWIDYGCHLEPPPGNHPWETLVFAVIPVAVSVLLISIFMAVLYIRVRQKSRASNKWRFGFGKENSLERRVFWQAILYTLSFYITWPIWILVYTTGIDFKSENYWFSIIVAFVAPLQGFNNFLVYIRPRATAMKEVPLVRRASSLFSTAFFRRHSGQRLQRTDEEIWEDESPLELIQKCVDPSVLISRVTEDPFPPIPEGGTGSRTEEDEEEVHSYDEDEDEAVDYNDDELPSNGAKDAAALEDVSGTETSDQGSWTEQDEESSSYVDGEEVDNDELPSNAALEDVSETETSNQMEDQRGGAAAAAANEARAH